MKRSPIRRQPLRATASPKAEVKLPRAKKCKVCAEPFRPSRGLQSWCGPECGVKLAAKLVAKKQAKAAADDKKQTRAQLEALKTIPQLIAEAQVAFNKFVRLRDAGRGCISCGVNLGGGSVGGDADAGHYRSRGAAPHLRFHEDNCHAQCKRCNRYGAGNVAAYRIGLLERIGSERVNALEADNAPVKWTRDMLNTIKTVYRAKARELEKADV